MTRVRKALTRFALEQLEDRCVPTVFVVNTVLDNPSAPPWDTDGQISLREAIQAANYNIAVGDAAAGLGFDSIAFDASLSGKTIVLGGTSLTVTEQLSIDGLGADQLTINGDRLSRVFDVTGNAIRIAGLTITNGYRDSGGGGIYNAGGLTLTGVTLSNNGSFASGGAIFNLGTLTISSSRLTDNTAAGSSPFSPLGTGGAIANYGSTTITNSTLSGNAANWAGGAVYSNGALWIADSDISDNNGDLIGGGIASIGSLSISGSKVFSNSSFVGGGIWNAGVAFVSGCTVSQNTAEHGAGLLNYRDAEMIIIDSSIAANTAFEFGGGVGILGGAVTLRNCTVSGNSANDGGGVSLAPVARGAGGTVDLINSTLVLNRADVDGDGLGNGGGFYTDGLLEISLKNSIVAGNVTGAAGSEHADDIYGLVNAASAQNLIGDAATAGGLMDGVNLNIVGNAGAGTIDMTRVLDPQLRDNGGPTMTHALIAGSLAIDAGGNGFVNRTTDQRGGPRILDGNADGLAVVDIGAVEYATPEGLINHLMKQVMYLGESGILNNGQRYMLLAILNQASSKFNNGDQAGCAQFLNLFSHQVDRLVGRGQLPGSIGTELMETALFTIDLLDQ